MWTVNLSPFSLQTQMKLTDALFVSLCIETIYMGGVTFLLHLSTTQVLSGVLYMKVCSVHRIS